MKIKNCLFSPILCQTKYSHLSCITTQSGNIIVTTNCKLKVIQNNITTKSKLTTGTSQQFATGTCLLTTNNKLVKEKELLCFKSISNGWVSLVDGQLSTNKNFCFNKNKSIIPMMKDVMRTRVGTTRFQGQDSRDNKILWSLFEDELTYLLLIYLVDDRILSTSNMEIDVFDTLIQVLLKLTLADENVLDEVFWSYRKCSMIGWLK